MSLASFPTDCLVHSTRNKMNEETAHNECDSNGDCGIYRTAAWLPSIAYWVYGWLVKPVVQIVPEKQIELGFTFLGPIFNIRLAMSACHRDAIIDRIWVELQHESGEVRILTWTGMRETFSEITDAAGNRQMVERDQPAIALKLTTSLLTEKFVRFQSLDFHEGRRILLNALAEHFVYLNAQEADPQEAIMASRQLYDIVEFHKTSFWWKPGRYTVQFGIEGRESARTEADALQFELMQHDVDALQQNLNLIKLEFENAVKSSLPGFEPHALPWAWRNIPLVKV